MTVSNAPAAKPANVRNGLIFIAVVLIAVAALAAAAFTQRAAGDAPVVVRDAPPPISANVQRVAYSDAFELTEAFAGLAAARRDSALGFETGGRIADIAVDTGDRVAKGAVLAQLDTRALEAQLAAAEAQVAEAEASQALAQVTVDRQRILVDRGHVAEQAYDEAFANSTAATARIAAAQASADAIRVQLDLARMRAPYAGVITARLADEGAIASPGSPVLRLVEADAVEARIGLPVALAAELTPGGTYELTADGRTYLVTFRAATGVIDAADRTVACVFDFQDPAAAPGAVVRLKLDQTVRERGFWAPVTALTEADRGLWSIYVAAPDAQGVDRAERRLVELIHAEADRAYVRGAVEQDEAFIIDGLQRLTPGAAVKVVAAGA